jgi:WD40 repeat protein
MLYEIKGDSTTISIGWSPDGNTIATGQWDGKILRFLAGTGEALPPIDGYTHTRSDVNGLAWSPEGHMLATAHQDGHVRLWDASGEMLSELRAHSGWARGIAWSPSGKMLVTTGEDATVRVWNVDNGKNLFMDSISGSSSPLWGVSWAPDGNQLTAGSGYYNDRLRGAFVGVWTLP